MTRLARPLAKGSGVCDTSWKLTLSQARGLMAAGETTFIRYVFFGPPRQGDIDAEELDMLLGLGATVILVQHVRSPENGLSGWIGSVDRGTSDAQWAIRNAEACGYKLDGTRLLMGLDLEDIVRGGPDHAGAWCRTIADVCRPLVYVGYASGMSTSVLDSLAGDPRFWCDFAPLPLRPTPTRGWDLHQQPQTTVAGIGIDRDTVMQDGTIYGLADGDVYTAVSDPVDTVADTLPPTA